MRPSSVLSWRLLGVAAVTGSAFAAALSGCGGAATSLQNDVLAPLTVLGATDVMLETNLAAAVHAHEADLAIGSAGSGISSVGTTPGGVAGGPPTSESTVSQASNAGGNATVFSAFNPLTHHCLGIVLIDSPGSTSPVLGESAAGAYDLWFGPTTASACTASSLVAQTTVPGAWGSGDPAATGFPSA
jgi:hypothetical protein